MALLIAVAILTRRSAALAAASTTYRARAEEVQRSIQQRFWDSPRKIYVNQAGEKGPAAAWAAGVAVSALDGAVRYHRDPYQSLLLLYFNALDRYWDRKQKIPGYEPLPTDGDGNDKYYDDNAWMAITFCEAYAVTGNPRILERARQTTNFVLSGWDDQLGGGIWWHEKHKGGAKNTCANGPAAVACLRLAPYLPPAGAAKYRAAAERIVVWTRAHLQNDDGRFGDNIEVATAKVNRGSLTYNTALMIDAQLLLWLQTGRSAYRDEAEREAKASDAYVEQKTGAYRDGVKWSHLMVEADLAVARTTADTALAEHLRKRAHTAVDADYSRWLAEPSMELIDVAAVARELWLLAETETAAGKLFWQRYDGRSKLAR